VNTTGTVWLGLAFSCAQCHDHKYDPLTKADFYRFFDFFNQVPEKGLDGNKGNAEPVLKLPTAEQSAQLADLDRQVAEAEARLADPQAFADAQAAWETAASASSEVVWTNTLPLESTARGGARFVALEDRSLRVEGPNPDQDVYTLRLANPWPVLTAIRLEALPDDSLADRGPGRSGNGNFVLTGVRLRQGSTDLPLGRVSADFSQPGVSRRSRAGRQVRDRLGDPRRDRPAARGDPRTGVPRHPGAN
jgi:hypothetical protein